MTYEFTRAFRTRPFRRTRTQTQTEVRNSDSDSDSGSDLRNRDFPTPWVLDPKLSVNEILMTFEL
jgi:hypothetical protein